MKKNSASRVLLGLAVAGLSGGLVAGVLSPEGVSAKSDKVSVITNIKDDTKPTTSDSSSSSSVVESSNEVNSGVTNVAPKDVVPGTTTEPEEDLPEVTTSPQTGIFGGADEAMMAASGVGFAMLVGSIILLSGGITFAVEERRK